MNSKGINDPILYFSTDDKRLKKVWKITVDAHPINNTLKDRRAPSKPCDVMLDHAKNCETCQPFFPYYFQTIKNSTQISDGNDISEHIQKKLSTCALLKSS